MKSLLSETWADLRDKRLWPVAVLLVAGLVAVPILLRKAPEETPPPEPAAAAQPSSAPEPKELAGLSSVKLEDAGGEGGSSLDTFDPSDPFRPPREVVKASEQQSAQQPSQSGDVTLGQEVVQGGLGAVDSGPSVDDGGGSGADPGGGTTGGQDDDQGTTTETTEYAYVIDVTFTNNGRTRRVKGMERLDMLPNAASPLLLFLGVSTDAGNAVFLVDSTLEPAGEGRCEPSAAECAFLHLGAGSEHMFTNEDGDAYRLRIDQIRKVEVDKGASASPAKARRGAHGASVARSKPRGLRSPLISDLVSVSSSRLDGSTSGPERR
jgi:hypothetical protein